MISRFSVCVLVLFATISIFSSNHAQADAIDGNWCFKDGKHMTITGPQIVTPTGRELTGDYTRHTFSYTVPEGDPGAGVLVSMVQQNEEVIHVMRSGKSKTEKNPEMEIWRRCKPVA